MEKRLKKWFKGKKWKGIFEDLLKSSSSIEELVLRDGGEEVLKVSKKGHWEREEVFPLFLDGRKVLELVVRGRGEGLYDKVSAPVKILQQWLETEQARRAVTEEALKGYRELSFLHHIASVLNRSLNLQEVAEKLLNECRSAVPRAKHGAIFVAERPSQFKLLAWFGKGGDRVAERVIESRLVKEVLKSGKPEIVNQVGEDPRWEVFIPEIISIVVAPLSSPERTIGVLFLAGIAAFSSHHLKKISTLATIGATALANALNFYKIQRMLEAVMITLATAIDSRDPTTAGHSRRVAQYAWWLAEAINEDEEFFPGVKFSDEEMQELYYAALLHDVGKIGVREHVLSKASKLPKERMETIFMRLSLLEAARMLPEGCESAESVFERLERINVSGFLEEEDRKFVARIAEVEFDWGKRHFSLLTEKEAEAFLIPKGNLTKEEWDEIRKHPAESERILRKIPFPEHMSRILTIVRQHHEKLDGSGYPDGLSGEKILLQSRILAVCDIYDALTASDRPYKKAFSSEKAVEILRKEAEAGKIDRRVVEVFVRKVLNLEEAD